MLLKHRDKKSLRFELIEPQRFCDVSVNNRIRRVGVVKEAHW